MKTSEQIRRDLQRIMDKYFNSLNGKEVKDKEEICFDCGGTGIWVENKYSAQERQEKGCKHLYGYYKLDENDVPKCRICDKPRPERIEELDLPEQVVRYFQQIENSRSSEILSKIDEIIKAVNKLNNN